MLRPSPAVRDVDPPLPPPAVLARHNARILDPVTAVRLPPGRSGEQRLRPTTYVADSMLLPSAAFHGWAGRELTAIARRRGMQTRPDELSLRLDEGLRQFDQTHTIPVRFVPDPESFSAERHGAPDAWEILQELRLLGRRQQHEADLAGVGLDHLLFPATGVDIGGAPVWGPQGIDGAPVWGPQGAVGVGEYSQSGRGGRSPVAYVGRPPQRTTLEHRRPVVAILDTGYGRHGWLPTAADNPADPVVTPGDQVLFNGIPAQRPDIPDPEASGDVYGPLDRMLDLASGHGTFIGGLIRQLCPDADLLPVRVMQADGVVRESHLLQALDVLLGRLDLAQNGETDPKTAGVVDVIVLSLGYYHETPEDKDFDPVLLKRLRELGQAGVAVIAAAGNQATVRPMYPAAFSPYPGGIVPTALPTEVPVLSVGGRNPDGTVALFSNDGPWVSQWELGASLVSTFPTTFDGGAGPSVAFTGDNGQVRSTIDPDSYRGGFGTWSGTSFAAPVLAGRIAQALIDGRGNRGNPMPSLDDADKASALRRGWSAVSVVTGMAVPQ